MQHKKFVFIIILLLLIINYTQAQDIILDRFVTENNISFNWNPFLEWGELIKQDKIISFRPNSNYIVVNGETIYSSESIRYNSFNQLTLSSEMAQQINQILIPANINNQPYNITMIMIDPGHGGKDWGAYRRYVVDGVAIDQKEKNINLNMALMLKDLLQEKLPNIDVVLTREDDRYLSLQERVDMAEAYSFDPHEGMVYFSVHTNSAIDPRGTGFEVWYLPDYFKRDLIDSGSENIDTILNGLWNELFQKESQNLSRYILNSYASEVDYTLLNRGIKQERWYMLTNQNMISCLIELAFVSNPDDATLLRDPLFLESGAEGIANGIVDFIDYYTQGNY